MYNTNMEKDEETKLSVERQKFQMHKKGYDGIVKAIESIPKAEIEIPAVITLEMSETNKILSELVKKMNEPICLTLKLK